MSHRLILRLAIGLTVFLALVALAFAWSAGLRDGSLTARLETATAPVGGAPPRNEEPATPPAGIEAFEKRCARCHAADDVTAWTAKQSGNRCEALYELLQKHRKAPEPENRGIALLFDPGCSGDPHTPERSSAARPTS
ncbi:MAG TPA: hypothetical protein VMT66_16025 [Steroidobacteraceae bacterium]|nr:hypothetical protein [Steroidobacteraceae bacterium]